MEDRNYQLIDGNHRLEASLSLGISSLPIHVIDSDLRDNDKKRLARQANEAAEAVVPTTFVDDVEFIWKEASQGKTLEEIKDMLAGWGLDKVKKYSALRQIHPNAWAVIVPTFDQVGTQGDEENGTTKVPTGTFTEGLLRSILPLKPKQQCELVQSLADAKIKKKRFTELAEAYRARNDAKRYAFKQLGALGYSLLSKVCREINKGAYDTDWLDTTDHPRLHKLIDAIRDEWNKKHDYQTYEGDFLEQSKEKVGNESIDLILTDPPYNIANNNKAAWALAACCFVVSDEGVTP